MGFGFALIPRKKQLDVQTQTGFPEHRQTGLTSGVGHDPDEEPLLAKTVEGGVQPWVGTAQTVYLTKGLGLLVVLDLFSLFLGDAQHVELDLGGKTVEPF